MSKVLAYTVAFENPDEVIIIAKRPDEKEKRVENCCGDDYRCSDDPEWLLIGCSWGHYLCEFHRKDWMSE